MIIRTSFRLFYVVLLCMPLALCSQSFYFGADLSYVNEMEACGVVYQENQIEKDPYQIFADHNCNLVRLRLWHTPSWYDDLNSGQRFSDFQDVKQSIARAKSHGMSVLLDFHLSDNWADPSKQLVPAAWLGVVNDLPKLQDSLYAYITSTLLDLHAEDLLPEMVQIGNETNKGILLSPEDNATWTLDWERNSQLFNTAFSAVEAVEIITGKDIKTAIHIAGPDASDWLVEGFIANGVTGFEVIGLSYYWAWHQPTTIQQTGTIIQDLKQTFPDKEVILFETGYIWTWDSNDNANNIINEVHPNYSPPSPTAQRDWLIDLTEEVITSGGNGVIYWEPAWVSSNCWTQWGQGSHQEHATFFDFNNNLIEDGGISWMEANYPTSTVEAEPTKLKVYLDQDHSNLIVQMEPITIDSNALLQISNLEGQTINRLKISSLNKTENGFSSPWPNLPNGIYLISIIQNGKTSLSTKLSTIK